MKAEHRKELETNSLAEGVGKLIQQVKKPKDRSLVIYLVIAVVVVGLLSLYALVRSRRVEQGAEYWLYLDNGGRGLLSELMKESNAETNQGKSARLQFAWIKFWENGVKSIGSEPDNAMRMLDGLVKEYRELADSCKGDPVFEPEALYAMAVIEETRAIQDRRQLDVALQKYKDLAKDHPKSAHGIEAAKRVEVLEDPRKRAEIVQFYQDMQQSLRVPPPEAMMNFNDKKGGILDKLQGP
jgi:hypothetical protein